MSLSLRLDFTSVFFTSSSVNLTEFYNWLLGVFISFFIIGITFLFAGETKLLFYKFLLRGVLPESPLLIDNEV